MKDLDIIEEIVLGDGRIVTHEQIQKYLSDYSDVNKKIHSLMKKGFLVGLKKGSYYVSKLGSLGYTSISNYIIANTIGEKSFVSFEAALKFHGLFDQGLKKYRSISLKQYLEKELEKVTYQYVKVQDSSYFGFEEEDVHGGQALIATKERAVLDLLEHKRTIGSISLVLEKLKNYDFEVKTIKDYLKNYSQTTIKITGFLMDLAGLESRGIEKLTDKNVTAKMLDSAKAFNNKWRLYYNANLEK